MGAVIFGIPTDLAESLVMAGALTGAVETGTYLGDTAIALRKLVPKVWSVELIDSIYRRAQDHVGRRDGINLLLGYSPVVLEQLASEVGGPTLFWLDAHGKTGGVPDVPDGCIECPVLDEIAAIAKFPGAAESCILIDDARTLFGPMLAHNPAEWPTFIEVSDALRSIGDRYVTVLDDIVIAVPGSLRPVVDGWWRTKLRERHGYEAMQDRILQLSDPSPLEASLRLARSLLPAEPRDRLSKWLSGRGVKAPLPRRSYIGSDTK